MFTASSLSQQIATLILNIIIETCFDNEDDFFEVFFKIHFKEYSTVHNCVKVESFGMSSSLNLPALLTLTQISWVACVRHPM